jgi:hypothetical protein
MSGFFFFDKPSETAVENSKKRTAVDVDPRNPAKIPLTPRSVSSTGPGRDPPNQLKGDTPRRTKVEHIPDADETTSSFVDSTINSTHGSDSVADISVRSRPERVPDDLLFSFSAPSSLRTPTASLNATAGSDPLQRAMESTVGSRRPPSLPRERIQGPPLMTQRLHQRSSSSPSVELQSSDTAPPISYPASMMSTPSRSKDVSSAGSASHQSLLGAQSSRTVEKERERESERERERERSTSYVRPSAPGLKRPNRAVRTPNRSTSQPTIPVSVDRGILPSMEDYSMSEGAAVPSRSMLTPKPAACPNARIAELDPWRQKELRRLEKEAELNRLKEEREREKDLKKQEMMARMAIEREMQAAQMRQAQAEEEAQNAEKQREEQPEAAPSSLQNRGRIFIPSLLPQNLVSKPAAARKTPLAATRSAPAVLSDDVDEDAEEERRQIQEQSAVRLQEQRLLKYAQQKQLAPTVKGNQHQKENSKRIIQQKKEKSDARDGVPVTPTPLKPAGSLFAEVWHMTEEELEQAQPS